MDILEAASNLAPSIAPLIGPIVGLIKIFNGLPHRAFSSLSGKHARPKDNELLEEIERVFPMSAKAEARNDVFAQDVAANERKRLIQQFSKQISTHYIPDTISNCILLVSFLFCSIGSTLFAQTNDTTRIFWIVVSVICLALALAHAFLIILDLPFWAPVRYSRGRRFSNNSSKKGFFISFEHALNAIETKAQCHLVDARPYAKAFKLHLVDSIYAFDNPHRPLDHLVTDHVIENLEQRLPDKTHAVFVCSEFGRESHEIVVKLRDRGYGDVYDLGETATRYALFQRFAHRLHYLAIEKERRFS